MVVFSSPNIRVIKWKRMRWAGHVALMGNGVYVIIIISIQPLAGTRAKSGDRYGSGTLHSRQVLRGSLPLLSPIYCIYVYIVFCWGNLREGDHLDGPGLQGRIILKLMFKKCNWCMDVIYLGNKRSGSIKCGEFLDCLRTG
jgi:hypothetical protein